MGGEHRWRNLGYAAGAMTAVLFAAFDLYKWVEAYLSDKFHNDFTFYYAAARIGAEHGWRSIYDLALMQGQLDAMGSKIHVAELARFISPPPMAWLALPFTVAPLPAAYIAWSVMLLGALVLTWHLAAPGSGRLRLIHLAAALAWLPIIYGLQLGQPGFLVALGVAASYWLTARGQPGWAGVALGLMVLKPQLAILVPPALLLTGRRREFTYAVATVALIALVSVIALGGAGVATYIDRLAFASQVPVNRELALGGLFESTWVARAVEIAVATWALAVVYRLRRLGPELPLAAVLVGGLLATPYLHLDDFMMLGLAGWLLLKAGAAPNWTWLPVLAMVVILEGVPLWGAGPVIAGELIALALLSRLAIATVPASPPATGYSASMYG